MNFCMKIAEYLLAHKGKKFIKQFGKDFPSTNNAIT